MELNQVAASCLLMGVVGIGACTSVKRVQPTEFLAKNSPDVVWVTHANSTVVPVAQPEIAGDTLKGIWQGTLRPVAIPLGEVQRVQARVPDHTKTALFVTTLGVAIASSVYFIWISKAGPMPSSASCGYDVRGFPIAYC